MTVSSATKIAEPQIDYAKKLDEAAEAIRSLEPTGSPHLPGFARVDSAKRAGRLNASTTSDEEFNGLLDERKRLLDKKFSSALTRQEENRLQYVRWSLERIEDARHGHELDALEAAINQYEHFYDDLLSLKAQLAAFDKSTRK